MAVASRHSHLRVYNGNEYLIPQLELNDFMFYNPGDKTYCKVSNK